MFCSNQIEASKRPAVTWTTSSMLVFWGDGARVPGGWGVTSPCPCWDWSDFLPWGGDLPHLQVLRVEPQSRQRQKQLLVTKKCSHLWLYYLRLILTWLRRRYLRYGGGWERPPTQEPDTPGETDTSQITAPAKWRIGRFQPSPHPPQEVALPWF